MDTDKNKGERLFQPMQDRELIGVIVFSAPKCLRIWVHLCPSVIKVWFNWLDQGSPRIPIIELAVCNNACPIMQFAANKAAQSRTRLAAWFMRQTQL
jgi:hypothetical protein